MEKAAKSQMPLWGLEFVGYGGRRNQDLAGGEEICPPYWI